MPVRGRGKEGRKEPTDTTCALAFITKFNMSLFIFKFLSRLARRSASVLMAGRPTCVRSIRIYITRILFKRSAAAHTRTVSQSAGGVQIRRGGSCVCMCARTGCTSMQCFPHEHVPGAAPLVFRCVLARPKLHIGAFLATCIESFDLCASYRPGPGLPAGLPRSRCDLLNLPPRA